MGRRSVPAENAARVDSVEGALFARTLQWIFQLGYARRCDRADLRVACRSGETSSAGVERKELSFRPLNKCRWNLVAHDEGSQNAIVAKQRRGSDPCCVNCVVASPGRGNTARRAAPHRRNQLEHVDLYPRRSVSRRRVRSRCPELHITRGGSADSLACAAVAARGGGQIATDADTTRPLCTNEQSGFR